MLPSTHHKPARQPERPFPRPAKARHIRAALLAATVLAMAGTALPARADVIGAIVGGAVGSQFGKGNGRIASAAIGAVIGDRISGPDSGFRPFGQYHQGHGVRGGYNHHGGHDNHGNYGAHGRHGHGGYGHYKGYGVYGNHGGHGHHGQHRHLHQHRSVHYVHPSTVVYGATPVIIVPSPAYGSSGGACVVPPGDYPNGVVCQPPGMQGIPQPGQPGVPMQPGSPGGFGGYGVQPNGYPY